MNNWNRLLVALDQTIGFPNKIQSRVVKRWQGFDMWKNEHVIVLEYRAKVSPGIYPANKAPMARRDVHRDPYAPPGFGTIRELMDVRFVNKVDSSPSLSSAKKVKKKMASKPSAPKKTRPNPPASPIKPV